ncbi:MAG: hypothetical protein M3Y53_12440 [Thermoproteota archaeon]|nr:hypothetical protein [Thermoproteota archaeon]
MLNGEDNNNDNNNNNHYPYQDLITYGCLTFFDYLAVCGILAFIDGIVAANAATAIKTDAVMIKFVFIIM